MKKTKGRKEKGQKKRISGTGFDHGCFHYDRCETSSERWASPYSCQFASFPRSSSYRPAVHNTGPALASLQKASALGAWRLR